MGFWLREPDDGRTSVSTTPGKTNRATTAPYNAPRAITASGERITVKNAAYVTRSQLEWQRAAWVAFERVGEIHFGFSLKANLMSRVRFYGAAKGLANEPPTDVELPGRKQGVSAALEEAVKQLVDELFAYDGPGLLRNFVLNLELPGECLLLQLPGNDVSPPRWVIRSTTEVQVRGDTSAVLVSRRDGGQQTNLPAGTYIARLWRRHPQYSTEADSSMYGVTDAVEELLMLQRMIRGTARSKLNAGLLFMPDGVASAVGPQRAAEPATAEEQDPDAAFAALRAGNVEDPTGQFMSDLVETLTAPINDETSAATVVPLVVTGPGDEGAKIRHITFDRPNELSLTDRVEKVLDRVLNGIDIPKEIVTGMQNVRYSNAVVIDEGMYKASVEPLALTAADAFTSFYLHPRLRSMGFKEDEIRRVVIWYDPSEIVTRPNSADEATEGLDRQVLSPAAWRREHGYAETDAPSEEERAQMLVAKLVTLPESAQLELLRRIFPKMLGELEDPGTKPLGVDQQQGPNVVQFPQSQPAADPQRTAIQQVGVK